MADKYSHAGDTLQIPVASATVIDVGDIVNLDTSGQVEVVDAVTDVPIGIAETSSASGATDPVVVSIANGEKVFDMVLGTAATLNVGDRVKYTSDKKIVKCTDSENAIGEVAEDMAASGTAVRVRLYGVPRDKMLLTYTHLLDSHNTSERVYFSMPCAGRLVKAGIGVGIAGSAGSSTWQLLDDGVDLFETDPTLAYGSSPGTNNGSIKAATDDVASGSQMIWKPTAAQTGTTLDVSLVAIFEVDGFSL